MNTRILAVIAAVFGLLLAACTTEPIEPDPLLDDNDLITVVQTAGDVQMSVRADAQPNGDGTTAGELELNITFENLTGEEVELNLADEDFVLMATDGVALTPTTISGELEAETLAANETVSGTIDYTVASAIATYTLNVTGFEPVTIDANVDARG